MKLFFHMIDSLKSKCTLVEEEKREVGAKHYLSVLLLPTQPVMENYEWAP